MLNNTRFSASLLISVKRSSEAMARVSRIVGCLYRLESSRSRDVWELRNPHSGKTNALVKLRKWNGFVSGCVHVTRSVRGRGFGKRRQYIY